MRTSIRAAGAATLAATLLSTGCTSEGTDSGASRTTPVVDLGKVKLVSYNGCDDMLAGLRAATVRNVGPWGVGDPGIMYAREGDMAARGKSDAPEHSTTNVHEPGADEPDLVKTDGRRVITVNRGVLRVVDTSTKKVTGTLKLVDPEQAWAPADLLVHGDRALVLFSGGGIIPYGARVKRAVNAGPRYVLIDLSGEPRVIGSLTPAGSHVDARMVGSTVRIVVRSQPELNFPDLGAGLTDTERTRRNVAFVRKAPIGAWLPKFEMTDDKGVTTNGAIRCERVSHPAEYTGTSMLTVHTLDLARGIGGTDPIGVAADGDTVYATPTSLYVTSNPRWWWPRSIEPPMIDDAPKPPKDAPRVEPTPSEATATFTAPSPSEPAEPAEPADEPAEVPPSGSPVDPAATATPTPAPPLNPSTSSPAPPKPAPKPIAPPEETEIHRFDITAPEAPRYVASGKVAGRLLNQYSLSEYEGHLRIATTTTVGQDSSSTVFILKADTLNPVGEVGGLGTGERIYSVRFIGPVGYVVTFREMDPLYTLDLSTPATPKKTGDLKITGYSAYLHPAGDGRLIGVGQEATRKGRALGTQVSLFDVTDPATPRRLSQMFQRNSGSEAEWNAHAFLYWPKTGTVVLPLNTWDGTWQTSGSALVLTVTDSAITTAGTIVHPKPKPRSSKSRPVPFDPSIRRSIVIGDELWTASDLGFKVNALKDLADRAWIPFS